jgi:hypothetical protein
MPPKTAPRKRSDAAKRKVAETANVAARRAPPPPPGNDFGRVFDENDPDNFISQLLNQNDHSWLTNRPHVSLDSTLHLANEQLRLASVQRARMARFGDDLSAPSVDAPNVAVRVAKLRRNIASTAAQLHERTIKLQLSSLATSSPSSDAQRAARLRERAALERQIHALQKTHQSQVVELQRLCDGYSKTPSSTTKQTKVIDATNGLTPGFGNDQSSVSAATARVFDDDARAEMPLHPPSHRIGVIGDDDEDDDDVLFDVPTM